VGFLGHTYHCINWMHPAIAAINQNAYYKNMLSVGKIYYI